MKKHVTALFALLLSVNLFAVDNILLDFESGVVPSTVSSWLNYSNSGTSASTWSAANPLADAINATNNCYKISKKTGDPYWTGLEVNLTSAISITTSNQYLHVLVFKNSTSRIALTYTPQGGKQSADDWQSNNTTGGWVDYVLTIPTGVNLKTFAVKIADDAGDYYFDQIMLSDNSTPLSRTVVTIDPTVKNQVIEGWGGSLCWWANIMGGYSDAKVKTICDWITDPVNGLNMNIFRFNIGGGDDPAHSHMRADGGAMPGYKTSLESPYDWKQDANQRRIIKQLIASRMAKAGKNDVIIVGFSNSPPYWMTVSGCSAGSTAGNVTNLKSDMFDDFADYLTEVAKYYHDSLGITFNYLEPFNEPDGNWWKALGNQEGCYFSDNDQMAMIRELYAKLKDKNMLSYCQITANDANNMDNGLNSAIAYKSAGDIVPKLGLISVHSYGGNNRAGLANWARANNKTIWQSESGPLNVGGTDEFQIMTMSDRIVTDLNNLKCTAWIDWQLGSDNSPTWGLIMGSYNNILNPLSKAMSFYVRAQYSRYVKAGYTIIGNSEANIVTAISPDEKELVVVLSNSASGTQKYAFDLSKFSNFGKCQMIRTRAQASLNVQNYQSSFTIAGNTFTFDALSESVSTFVIPISQPNAVGEVWNNPTAHIYYSNGLLYADLQSTEEAIVTVFNSLGKTVKAFRMRSSASGYPIRLEKGVYLLSAKIGNRLISQKVLVF